MTTYSNIVLREAALEGRRVAVTMSLGGPAASIEGYVVAVEERDLLLAMTTIKQTVLTSPVLTIIGRGSIIMLAFSPDPSLADENKDVQDFVAEHQQVVWATPPQAADAVAQLKPRPPDPGLVSSGRKGRK